MPRLLCMVMVCICVFLPIGLVMGDAPPTKDSGPWPRFSLPVPDDVDHRQYLGLKPRPDFSVDDIGADVIIVQIFSMYCPICQREAPRVNQLFNAIDQRGDLKTKLKIVGIGAGNSAYEVDFYRNSYKVKFPLFADGEFKVHQLLGEVGTPHFYLLKRAQGGSVEMIYQKSGGFKDPEEFLSVILRRAGME